jgi:acetate kinase
METAQILTVNGGSSSIKFALFEAGDSLPKIFEGRLERIGSPDALLTINGSSAADHFSRAVTASDYTAAVTVLMDWVEERVQHKPLSAVGALRRPGRTHIR